MAKRKKTPDILADQTEGRAVQGHAEPQALTADGGQTEIAQPPAPTPADPFAAMFLHDSDPPLPFSTTVKLTVTGPERLRRATAECLIHELQALGDTAVVDEDAEWELAVLGTEIQTARGGTYGVALSIVVLCNAHLTKEKSGSRGGPSNSPPPSPFSEFRGVWLRVAAKAGLWRQCQEIIADFDATHLDAPRRLHRRLVADYRRRQAASNRSV